jgi:hypothetical protein
MAKKKVKKGGWDYIRTKPLTPLDYYLIGSSAGLDRIDISRYSAFMQERFPEERDLGHAYEWAKKFKKAKDKKSRQILKKVEKELRHWAKLHRWKL